MWRASTAVKKGNLRRHLPRSHAVPDQNYGLIQRSLIILQQVAACIKKQMWLVLRLWTTILYKRKIIALVVAEILVIVLLAVWI